MNSENKEINLKKIVSAEGFICLSVFVSLFLTMGLIMGFSNAINCFFSTAYYLLMNVVWYLLALAVLMGALTGILSEFGVISLLNKLLSPLMKPLYGMPGATSIAIFTSFMSDNPAVLTLGNDVNYRRYFKKYQLAALTNIGTAYGMGLIVSVSMLSLGGGKFGLAVIIGVIAVVISSVLTTRLMLHKSKKIFGNEEEALKEDVKPSYDVLHYRETREGSILQRLFSSMLDGGADGVKVGFSIIPGVLIIASLVLLLTYGAPASGIYTGQYGEGIALIPLVGKWISPIIEPLFGFHSPELIAVPITALGSAGAAIGLVPQMYEAGIVTASNIAVITAICMFWSGYLSTHVSMMDSLNFRKLTGWSIFYHTIGGLCSGIIANFLYLIVSLII